MIPATLRKTLFARPRDNRRRTVRRRTPVVEDLEARRLLSLSITEYPVPYTQGITGGPDGNLWFAAWGSSQIGEINPTTHATTLYQLPTAAAAPIGITAGPDGNLWFLPEYNGDEIGETSIGEINPTTHAIADYPLPAGSTAAFSITAGPDGNLWFTQGSQIGKINPATHVITEYPTPAGESNPGSITVGPDGNLWFIDYYTNQIGEINPTTGAITEYSLPTGNLGPSSITAGPDGNLWFTDSDPSNQIGEINPTTHSITEYPIPTAYSYPSSITSGPDGNLWFTESFMNKIGEINPATHSITEYPLPGSATVPDVITVGPGGNLWFTDDSNRDIAEIRLLTLTASATSQNSGHFVSFTASLPAQIGSNAGTATFTIDGKPQAPVPFTNVNGHAQATLTTSTLALGSDTITATFNPVGQFAALKPTSNSVTVKVTSPTALQLIDSSTLSATGARVSFTAIVSATSGTPTGTVTFFVDGKSETSIALSTIDGVQEAVFTTSTLPQGSHKITANYNPSPNFLATPSATVTEQILDGPQILAAQAAAPSGAPSSLALTFNQPLSGVTAQDTLNYELLGPGNRRITVTGAVSYASSSGDTVVLSLAQRLVPNVTYTLIVNGVGTVALANTDGFPLDGEKTGIAGSSAVITITASK